MYHIWKLLFLYLFDMYIVPDMIHTWNQKLKFWLCNYCVHAQALVYVFMYQVYNISFMAQLTWVWYGPSTSCTLSYIFIRVAPEYFGAFHHPCSHVDFPEAHILCWSWLQVCWKCQLKQGRLLGQGAPTKFTTIVDSRDTLSFSSALKATFSDTVNRGE